MRTTRRSTLPAPPCTRPASSDDGIVAGSGDAIATIAGTPSRWRSGVATADPPFPNAPDRKPTATPISAAPRKICGLTSPLKGQP
jgi:hypothetical protein